VQQASEEPVRQVLPEPIVQEPEQAREPQASVPEPIEPGLDLQPEREQRA
jgi:hypothetical protein